jgi:hypothetical protein
MQYLYFAGAYLAVVIVGVGACWIHDRLWYQKHPGANEYFAQVDQELEAKGL